MNCTAHHRRLLLPSLLAAFALIATANAQWSANSAANLAIGDKPGDQVVPKIAAGGDGSTWIAWFDNASGNYDVFAQKLDPAGNEVFPHNGLLVSNNAQSSSLVDWDMISDGAGGAVITFTDIRAGGDLDVYAYRIDGAGQFLWGANGVALSNNSDYEANPKAARTTDGSFVFTWGQLPTPGPGAVRVQKLDAAGNAQWIAGGIPIQGAGTEKPAFSNIVASDAGSVIVSYVRDIATFASPRHLRTQKFDVNGNALWNGGTPIAVYDFNSMPIAYQPEILSDENGGAVYAWHRAIGVSGFDVLVQHIDASGTELFAHNGVAVSTQASTIKLDPSIAFLPASGDTIVLFDKRNTNQSQWSLSAQRVSSSGALLWTTDALDLLPLDGSVKSFERCRAFGDGAVGFCFFQPNGGQVYQVVGFRLDANGVSQWTPSPLAVSSASSSKGRLGAVIDGSGMARLAWSDARTDSGDIYAQNVNCDGTLGNTSPFGTSTYCIGAPNSVGPGASMGSQGSTCFALNNFTLTCSGLPPHTTGLFYYGANATQVVFGDGFRCVASPVIRLGPPQNPNPQGVATRYVNLTLPPVNGGAVPITAGSTRRFQFWYRNPNGPGGTGFNVSNALTAVFAP